jgi:hypothetical protein
MRGMVDLTVFSLLSFLPLERVCHSPHENNYAFFHIYSLWNIPLLRIYSCNRAILEIKRLKIKEPIPFLSSDVN